MHGLLVQTRHKVLLQHLALWLEVHRRLIDDIHIIINKSYVYQ